MPKRTYRPKAVRRKAIDATRQRTSAFKDLDTDRLVDAFLASFPRKEAQEADVLARRKKKGSREA